MHEFYVTIIIIRVKTVYLNRFLVPVLNIKNSMEKHAFTRDNNSNGGFFFNFRNFHTIIFQK